MVTFRTRFAHDLRLFGRIGGWTLWGKRLLFIRWIAKLGYLALALTGMAAFALGVGNSKWETGDIAEAAATFEQRWPALEDKAPTGSIMADAPIKSLDCIASPEPVSAAPEARPQQVSPIQLASLDPDARSLSAMSLDDSAQPAPTKGYIFYFNSPTHWAPVKLPDSLGEPRAPHDNNIRAEIEQAAMAFGVDIRMMKAFARIESGFCTRR